MATFYDNDNYTGRDMKFNKETRLPYTLDVKSLKVEPGFLLCAYEKYKYSGDFKCWDTNTVPNKILNNEIGSFILKRQCDHDNNKWYDGCNIDIIDTNLFVNDCKINSQCYINKQNECKKADLKTNLNCKKFYNDNHLLANAPETYTKVEGKESNGPTDTDTTGSLIILSTIIAPIISSCCCCMCIIVIIIIMLKKK